jgi:hypothetical protein
VKGYAAVANDSPGVISAHEGYSKQEVLKRLKISQKFWDKMLDDGLPYSLIGKSKWVTGKDLLAFLARTAEHKTAS